MIFLIDCNLSEVKYLEVKYIQSQIIFLSLTTILKMNFLKYCIFLLLIYHVCGRPIPEKFDEVDEEILMVLKPENRTTMSTIAQTTTPRPFDAVIETTEAARIRYIQQPKGKKLYIFLKLMCMCVKG